MSYYAPIRKAEFPVAGLGTLFLCSTFDYALEHAYLRDDLFKYFETKRESGNK